MAAETVDAYVASVPEKARPAFDALRDLVRATLPDAAEVVSYGVLGYKTGPGRARVYVAGYRDHVALYPLPADEGLRAELAPYVHGKGTLWFDLDGDLPRDLITRTVRALAEG